MFWKRGLRKFVAVKQFKGNIYPNYFVFIHNAGFPQDGFTPGDGGSSLEENHRFGWIKCYSGFDKETKQELAIIQKVIGGRKYQYVIKNSALEDEIIESMFRYNNSIWEWFE